MVGALLPQVGFPFLLQVVAPVHEAIPNASIEVMVNCMLAQSLGNWSLLVVSDGPSARVRRILSRYDDERIGYLETPVASRDHGHSPRRLGLERSAGTFTLLSGIDNYYVPLMVETVAVHATDDVGLVYFDFVLDMKGELEAGEAYDRAARGYDFEQGLVIHPLLDGHFRRLGFEREDDLHSVASNFVDSHGLEAGAGCDDAGCIVNILVTAMQAAIDDDDNNNGGGGDQQHTRPRALPPYTGHIDTALQRPGEVDIGAVAVRTHIAQAVGFHATHHAADFDYVQACRAALLRSNLSAAKIKQTLYVHN